MAVIRLHRHRRNAHATRGSTAFDRPGRFGPGATHEASIQQKSREATAAFLTTNVPDQAARRFTIASAKLLVLPLPPRSGVTLSRSLVMVSRIA